MFDYVNKKAALAVMGGVALTAIVAVPVMAQRDPAYEAARSSGKIGEKPDGYLGYVSSPSPAIKALVEDINIKRKAAYTRKAQETNSTVEQFAFTSGCNLIMRTEPGEKYQTPAGTWNTRDSSAPVRDSRCP
ncbi:YdbL family protein [Parasphingorhabdus sp.]|uniref:YdbL family protein n=1 Tax=Parasphingorhabdus sp. TaxID=2709688 RepID=UPI003FA74039